MKPLRLNQNCWSTWKSDDTQADKSISNSKIFDFHTLTWFQMVWNLKASKNAVVLNF